MPLDPGPVLRVAAPHRRVFLRRSLSALSLASVGMPALVVAQGVRPAMPYGLQLGDTTLAPWNAQGRARPVAAAGDDVAGLARSIVWARSDKPARMVLEWDTTDRFANPRRILWPHALETTDFTARVDLAGLPAGQHVFTRVAMEDLPARSAPARAVIR
jgi:alkaline phosphatase D